MSALYVCAQTTVSVLLQVSWFAQMPASKTRPDGDAVLCGFEEIGVREEVIDSVHQMTGWSRLPGRLGSPEEYSSPRGAADAEERQRKWERERWNWKMTANFDGKGTPPDSVKHSKDAVAMRSKGALSDQGRHGMFIEPAAETPRSSLERMYSLLLPDSESSNKRESDVTDPSQEITATITARNSDRVGMRDSIRSDADDDSLPNSMHTSARGATPETKVSSRKQELFAALESRLLLDSEENRPLSPNVATLHVVVGPMFSKLFATSTYMISLPLLALIQFSPGENKRRMRATIGVRAFHNQIPRKKGASGACSRILPQRYCSTFTNVSPGKLSLAKLKPRSNMFFSTLHVDCRAAQPVFPNILWSIAANVFAEAQVLQEPVCVMNVDPDGPASIHGLEVGDLLLEVNGVAVLGRPLQEIMTVVRGKAGSSVELVTSQFSLLESSVLLRCCGGSS